MTFSFETIAQLETSSLRRAWLQNHYPVTDRALIADLQSTAHELEQDDRRKSHLIAQLMGDAATLWQDQQTLAAALRVEAAALRFTEPLNALYKYEEAVRIYQELGLSEVAIDAAVGQVATLRALGRYDEALTTNHWIIEHFRTIHNDFGLARALLNHGLIYYYLGQFTEARTHYAEAHALFHRLNQPQWCAAIDSNDANVLEELNEYTAAEEKYQQARTQYVQAEMTNAVARIDHNLAYLHFSLGNYQRALQIFGRARDQFVAQESEIDVAFVDLYRTEIYTILNLWHKAIELARKTRPIFEHAQMPWETAQLLLNEAIALLHLQKSQLALAKLDQARHLLGTMGDTHWQGLVDLYASVVYLCEQEYESAAMLAQHAGSRFAHHGLTRRAGQCEMILGQIALALEQLDNAAQHFSTAQHLLGDYASPAASYRYQFGLARVYQLQGKAEAAETYYRKAIAAIAQLQSQIGAEDYKIAFWRDKFQVYEQFIHFCLEQKSHYHYHLAFEVLEKSKWGALRHLSPLFTAMEATHPMPAALQNEDGDALPNWVQIDQLKRELNRYYTQFHTPDAAFSSDADVARLHSAILTREQQLRTLLDLQQRLDFVSADVATGQTHIPLATLQSSIPKGTILLQYFFVEDDLTIFCIERENFTVHQVHFSLENLQELVRQFNFQISKFHLGTRFRERHRRLLQNGIDLVLHQLYQLLIAPVAGLLENVDHIIVVPHQVLHNLPFHAFYDGKRYLLETFGISYAISATFQHKVRQRQPATDLAPPLILGLNDQLIQQAEAEAHAVGQIFPTAELYCGEHATSEHLCTSPRSRSFIHLATHGVFRADSPTFSALKLADGWLTLQELATLQHSAPLITLSACNTGRSEYHQGNHVADFYRSFFRTGAQSLVVSLWSLEDQAAIHVMSAFYAALRQGCSVYSALRKAQLTMMANWCHPYYWAPFILTGDPYLNHLATTDADRSVGSDLHNGRASAINSIIELHP